MRGPAEFIARISSSRRLARSIVNIMSSPRWRANGAPLSSSRSKPSARVRFCPRTSASNSSTIRLSSSSAPPRRWRYCCANSGPCEPISPASTAIAKANLRANIGCPVRLPEEIAAPGAAVERRWRRGAFLPPIKWRYDAGAAARRAEGAGSWSRGRSLAQIPVGVLTISDRAAKGVYEDKGGPGVEAALAELLATPWRPERRLVPDERPAIEAALIALADGARCPLILATGGTGPAPRAGPPQATQ